VETQQLSLLGPSRFLSVPHVMLKAEKLSPMQAHQQQLLEVMWS